MTEFLFPLVGFGGVSKGTKSVGVFSGVNEVGVVSIDGNYLVVTLFSLW